MSINGVEVTQVSVDVEAAYADAAQMLERYPWRGPAAAAHGLRPYITDKVVCDLGCGGGDLAWLMGRWAKKVIGVELDAARYKVACTPRGADNVTIRQLDYFKIAVPVADVYYAWPNDPATVSQIADMLALQCPEASLIVGSRIGWLEQELAGKGFTIGNKKLVPNYLSIVSERGGKVVTFPYREDPAAIRGSSQSWPPEDVWCLYIITLGS